MRKNSIASLVLALAVALPLVACQDTKARQENEQLKARVSELEKENADLGNRVDGLAKDNSALAAENQQLKAKGTQKKKTPKSKRHRRTTKQPVRSRN
jgi:regulator of replication initiation timing